MSAAEIYKAAQQTCAWFPLPNRVLIEFTGGDRARFLHNFCTNDINGLAVNAGCEAIFTNIKARAMGHGFVFAGETSHWLETVRDGLDTLLKHLDKYIITDDVQFKVLEEVHQMLLTGPAAVERLAVVCHPPIDPLSPLTQAASGDLWLRRCDPFDQPGIQLAGTKEQLAKFASEVDAPTGDADVYEALRLEAGLPLYGTDVTEDHLAPEVGRIEKTISYRKGCYLGQEPIARIDALGHVNKSLCRITIDGGVVADVGTAITSGAGEDAGTVSSAAVDPTADRCVALAWLKREHAAPETELRLGDRTVTVTS